MRTRSSTGKPLGTGSVRRKSQRHRLPRSPVALVTSSSNASGAASIDVGGTAGEDTLPNGPRPYLQETTSRVKNQKPRTGTKPNRKLSKREGEWTIHVTSGAKLENGRVRMFSRTQDAGHLVKMGRLKSIASTQDKGGTSKTTRGNDLDEKPVVIRLSPLEDVQRTSDPRLGDNPSVVSGLFTLNLKSQAKTLQLQFSMDPKDVDSLLANVHCGKPTNAIIDSVVPSGQLETWLLTSPFPKAVEEKAHPPTSPPQLNMESPIASPIPTSFTSTPLSTPTLPHFCLSPPTYFRPAEGVAVPGIPINGEGGSCPITAAVDLSFSSPKTPILRVRTGRSHFPIKKRLSVQYKQFGCRPEDLSPSADAFSAPGLNPAPPPTTSTSTPSLPCVLSTRPPLVEAPTQPESFILPKPSIQPLPPPAAQAMMVVMSNSLGPGSSPVEGLEASKRLAIVLPVGFLSASGNASLALQPQHQPPQLIFLPQTGNQGIALVPQPSNNNPFGQVSVGRGEVFPQVPTVNLATCRVTNSVTAPIPASLVVPPVFGEAGELPKRTVDKVVTTAPSLFGDKPTGAVGQQPPNLLPAVPVNGIDNLLAADRYLSYCSISTDSSATSLVTTSVSDTTLLVPAAQQAPPPTTQTRPAPVGEIDLREASKPGVGSIPVPAHTVPNPVGKPIAPKRRLPSASVRGRFRCQECGLAFLKACLLRKHIQTHYDVRPYVCQQCNIAFKTRGNLSKHMKSRCHTERCSKDLGKGTAPVATANSIQIDTRALEKQRLLVLGKETVPDVKRPGRYRSIRACPTDVATVKSGIVGSQATVEQAASTVRIQASATRIPAPNVNVVHLQQELPLNLSVRPTQPTSLLEYTKEAVLDKPAGALLPSNKNNSGLETMNTQQLTVSSAETIIRSAVAAAMQSTNIGVRSLDIQSAPQNSELGRSDRESMATEADAAANEDQLLSGSEPVDVDVDLSETELTTRLVIDEGDPEATAEIVPVGETTVPVETKVKAWETSIAVGTERREARPYKCSACRVGFRVTGHLHKHYRAKSHLLTVLQANNLPTEVCEGQLSPSELIDPETGLLKERAERSISAQGHNHRTEVAAQDGL